MKTTLIAAGLVALAGSASAQFSGPYAPGNWSFTTSSGSNTNDGNTLVLTGNNGSNTPAETDYTIAAAGSGTFSFNWAYSSGDSGTWDSGGYLINGAYTQLADNGSQGSGSVAVAVNAGDIIGFRVFSGDGAFGAGVLEITKFSGPVPAPGALALLGLGGLVAGRRRR